MYVFLHKQVEHKLSWFLLRNSLEMIYENEYDKHNRDKNNQIRFLLQKKYLVERSCLIRFSIIYPVFFYVTHWAQSVVSVFFLYSYLKSQPRSWLTFSLKIIIKSNFNLYYTRMLQYQKFQPFWPRGFEDLKKCIFTSLKSSIPIVAQTSSWWS